jgi:hypothetical protein
MSKKQKSGMKDETVKTAKHSKTAVEALQRDAEEQRAELKKRQEASIYFIKKHKKMLKEWQQADCGKTGFVLERTPLADAAKKRLSLILNSDKTEQ